MIDTTEDVVGLVVEGGVAVVQHAMDSAGNILFSWPPPSNSNSIRNEVRMEWLAAGSSTPVPETIVNTTTQGSHQLPGVAATGNDSFVVVWQGYGASDPAGIYSQRFGPVSSTTATSTLSLQSATGTAVPGNTVAASTLQPTTNAGSTALPTVPAASTSATSMGSPTMSLPGSVSLDDFSGALSSVADQLAQRQEWIDQVFAELAADRSTSPS